MRPRSILVPSAAVTILSGGGVAVAQEAWVGVAAHAVNTPFALETGEGGLDI